MDDREANSGANEATVFSRPDSGYQLQNEDNQFDEDSQFFASTSGQNSAEVVDEDYSSVKREPMYLPYADKSAKRKKKEKRKKKKKSKDNSDSFEGDRRNFNLSAPSSPNDSSGE